MVTKFKKKMATENFSNLESKRNVSDKWIDNNVYDALETIEECERRMKNGCNDLLEYIQTIPNSRLILSEIQFKNMEIMLVEFDILLENTKEILKDFQYKSSKEKLNNYMNLFWNGIILKNGDKMKVANNISTKAERGSPKRIILNPLFYRLAWDLSRLRSEIVGYLSHILYVKDNLKKKQKEI